MAHTDPRARFWDRFADRYARSQMKDPETYEKKLAITQRYLGPEMSLLEIGCGTGSTALAHAPFVGRILATDVSGRMIEIARDKAKAAEVDNVRFEVATLETLNDTGPFDVVLALNVLHLLDDLETALRQVRALVKPGGLFVSSTPCLAERHGWLKPIAPVGRMLGLMPPVAFFTAEQLAEQIDAAGFAPETTFDHAKGFVRFIVCVRPAD